MAKDFSKDLTVQGRLQIGLDGTQSREDIAYGPSPGKQGSFQSRFERSFQLIFVNVHPDAHQPENPVDEILWGKRFTSRSRPIRKGGQLKVRVGVDHRRQEYRFAKINENRFRMSLSEVTIITDRPNKA